MTQISTIIRHIIKERLPLSQESHDFLLEKDRTLYTALLQLPGLSDHDSMQIIIRLLAVTETGGQPVPLEMKQLEDRLIAGKLPQVEVKSVLKGFKELADRKINNQRTAGWIRAFILGSPKLEYLAVSYRRPLAALLRHAMGKQTAQTCIHFLQRPQLTQHESDYLYQHLFKYRGDNDEDLLRTAFLFLFRALTQPPAHHRLIRSYLAARTDIEQGRGLPYRVLRGIAETYHEGLRSRYIRNIAGKEKVKREVLIGEELATGDTLVGHIRQYYLNGEDQQIVQKVIAEAERIPHWDARVALILDLSYSMKGSGVRAFNNVAIAIAIREVLEKKARELYVIAVGSEDHADFPVPDGATNLAEALITAYELHPDVILAITDGYENQEQGDARAILEATKAMGLNIPLLHILPAFTFRVNVEHRRPFGTAPVILETGEAGLLPLWLNIQYELEPEKMEQIMKRTLHPVVN